MCPVPGGCSELQDPLSCVQTEGPTQKAHQSISLVCVLTPPSSELLIFGNGRAVSLGKPKSPRPLSTVLRVDWACPTVASAFLITDTAAE